MKRFESALEHVDNREEVSRALGHATGEIVSAVLAHAAEKQAYILRAERDNHETVLRQQLSEVQHQLDRVAGGRMPDVADLVNLCLTVARAVSARQAIDSTEKALEMYEAEK